MKYLMLIIALAMNMASFAQTEIKHSLAIDDEEMDGYLSKKKPAVLKVKVLNSNKSIEGVQVKYTIVHPGAEMQARNYTRLDANGEADITLPENLPYQQVWLDIDGFFYTGVLVNEGLEIIVDANKIEKKAYIYGDNISFKGADAGLNKTLCKHTLYKKDVQEKLSGRLVTISIDAANKKLTQELFLKIADSVRMAMQQIDAEFLKENATYEWAVKNETNSAFYEWLVVGLNGSKEVSDDVYRTLMEHRPYFMSNSGVSFYRSLSSYLANKKEANEPDIQKMLQAYKTNMTTAQEKVLDSITLFESQPALDSGNYLKKLYAQRYRLFKQDIDAFYLQRALRSIEQNSEGRLTDILKLGLMERWRDKADLVYPLIIRSMKTNWTKRFVQNELDDFLTNKNEVNNLFGTSAKLSGDQFFIGKPTANLPFGAQLYTLDSIDNISDFIVNLKSKFKGKALVIDIWATWCGPCIADITNSKKLHEEAKDLPIAYIYLCTTNGSDIETWKTRIGTLKPPGTHIFIDEKLESAFRKKLNAEGGYPTYVVIDQKGNIGTDKISFMTELNKESLKKKTGVE